MINGKSVLAIIPARGGSKGVPRKNIKVLAGKPLIAWTIEEAQKSKYIDLLILSSDDAEIITVAKEWGCEAPFVRPPELATDATSGIEPILHAINNIPGYDYVVVLQPTSPLRKFMDIDGALETCINREAVACVSITKVNKTPYWMFSLCNDLRLKPFVKGGNLAMPRQLLPDIYELNGAIYLAETDWFKETKTFINQDTIGYIMPVERSLDIDSLSDFIYAETLIKAESY